MERGPGDEEGHDERLACACCELESVADEVAGFGHSASALALVEVDDGLDCLSLAKEESIPQGGSFLVAAEPPLKKSLRDKGRLRISIAAGPPLADLVPKLIHGVVEQFQARYLVVEQSGLVADDLGD